MPGPKRRQVRIEQPTANKITMFALAGTAVFVALVFISRIDAALFQAGLAVFGIAACVYAYRAIQIEAVADGTGISVTNLRGSGRHRWSDIDALTIGPVARGPGTGITIQLVDGSSVPVEASWGAWYEGKKAAANTLRCELIVSAIETMRLAPETSTAPAPVVEEMTDPVVVRPMTPEDAGEAASVLKQAWTETYGDILTRQALYERDSAEDTAMLSELTDGSIPLSGGMVVERNGEMVGLSVFGPVASREPETEGFVELYLIFVLDSERTSRAGTRLSVRTLHAIRAAGAAGAVAHIHTGQRTLTRRLEALGIDRHGDTTEQNWYGLPVKVAEYRRPFTSVPMPSADPN